MSYLILLDKPKGMTSFSAVAALRRKLGIKRIGHTGTLDPLATGVLPLLTGRASRLSSMMLEADKRYTASLRLGITTDSYDITGNVLSEKPVNITQEEFEKAAKSFIGVYSQIPPMYSAIKKDGIRLYELARRGEEVDRAARQIEIKKLTVIKAEAPNEYIIDVLCSKGTYIRSLVFDIGEALGCGATLTELRRTEVSGFSINDCITLEEIMECEDNSFLLSAEKCVSHLRSVEVSPLQGERFMHGGELDYARIKGIKDIADGEKLVIKSQGEFLGIGVGSDEKSAIKIGCIIKED